MNRSVNDRSDSTHLSRVTVGVAGLVLALSVTGCGGTAADDTVDSTAAESAGESAGGEERGPRGGQAPGAFGVIAAADGAVLQVQSQMSGQVAVTVDAGTEITDQVAGAFTDVEAGSCVVVQRADDAEDAAATAESVSISQPDDEGCTTGARGPGGMRTGRPSDIPSDRPSDPSERPSGFPSGRPGNGAGFPVAGAVTAVGADGFTVLASEPGGGGEQETAVSVTDTTTFTTQQAAEASALTVGRCVRATGEADDTGAVTAEQISVSDTVDGECATGGFGRRMGGDRAGS